MSNSTLSIADMIRQSAQKLDEERAAAQKPIAGPEPKTKRPSELVQAKRGKARLYPPMSREEILRLVAEIVPGGKFRVQYPRDENTIGDLIYLNLMKNAGVIEMGMGDFLALLAVQQSHQWESNRNRMFTLTASAKWDAEWFIYRVVSRIEAMRIIK